MTQIVLQISSVLAGMCLFGVIVLLISKSDKKRASDGPGSPEAGHTLVSYLAGGFIAEMDPSNGNRHGQPWCLYQATVGKSGRISIKTLYWCETLDECVHLAAFLVGKMQ